MSFSLEENTKMVLALEFGKTAKKRKVKQHSLANLSNNKEEQKTKRKLIQLDYCHPC